MHAERRRRHHLSVGVPSPHANVGASARCRSVPRVLLFIPTHLVLASCCELRSGRPGFGARSVGRPSSSSASGTFSVCPHRCALDRQGRERAIARRALAIVVVSARGFCKSVLPGWRRRRPRALRAPHRAARTRRARRRVGRPSSSSASGTSSLSSLIRHASMRHHALAIVVNRPGERQGLLQSPCFPGGDPACCAYHIAPPSRMDMQTALRRGREARAILARCIQHPDYQYPALAHLELRRYREIHCALQCSAG
ncbi:hypothetical protein SCP_0402090 [Sparassis crispa]|uniref:Uncharacterized protein n=1 Tax=Sparassis crispa TaxID=139825 RepID=A0A401GI18_9APHY|nr:hypothetical protein SCP_0402090 [Sparassis crispa]GBE81836.1 hypothetical protein SCP_0402090 [Sparassis crispa]